MAQEIIPTTFNADAITSSLSSAQIIINWVIGLLLVGGVIYFIYWLTSYNVKVNVVTRRGGNRTRIERTSGRYVKDKKNKAVKKFELLSRKYDYVGSLDTKFLYDVKSFFGVKEEVTLYEQDGKLHPMNPIEISKDGVDWGGLTMADHQWYMNSLEEADNVYQTQGFWDKYGQILMPMFGFIIVAVVFIVMFNQMETAFEQVRAGLGDVANALRELEGVGRQTIK